MTREFGINSPSNESYEQQDIWDERAEIIGGAVVAATEMRLSDVVESPIAMYGYSAGVEEKVLKQEKEAAEARRVESIKTLDKDAFKLGDLNPLIHSTDLMRNESVEAVRYTINEKIQKYGGISPTVLESTVVSDGKNAEPRFVARFEVPRLTPRQIELLEDLVKQTYTGLTVRTRTDSKGNDIPLDDYPPTQPGEEMELQTEGWYMGPMPVPTSPLHPGLFVYKDRGKKDKDKFHVTRSSDVKFIVEVREISQKQTDLVTFITQIAVVLGKRKLLDRGDLLYETYYDLIRLGLKDFEPDSMYGMDKAKDMIMRELIVPLASPDISKGVDEDPQSALLIGVPGTGKTLMAEWLLHEETGSFVLPIDPFELQKELAQPKEKQRLMHRIAEIASISGRPVILHVDDIENMATENEATNSTLLNLMAGVQESGFYIIASTNYPEKINKSLIQPQRFSILIHCGLQDEDARYEILKIHADMKSKGQHMPLFASEEVRDLILREVAKHTEAFTPRYLANIATIAKSFLIDRIVKAKGKTIGLTEKDLKGHAFTVNDWERAFDEVSAKYDSKEVKARDEALAEYVKKHKVGKGLGFAATNGTVLRQRIFSDDVHAKVAAAESGVGDS